MDSMFLHEVEEKTGEGPYAEMIQFLRGAEAAVPQIFHLFAFTGRTASVGVALSKGVQEHELAMKRSGADEEA